MSGWFVFWVLLLTAAALWGHATGELWLTLLPLLIPILWADQYLATHHSEEE